jgi:phosphohistidine phosphatase
MKTLLILRHAKSSWQDSGLDDHDRPLNKRGKQAAPQMGRLLKAQDLVPELIVSSTAKRARKTAALVAENCGYEGSVEVNQQLYHASAGQAIAVLTELYHDEARVMLVGHNPGVEELLEVLTGQVAALPTAALAQVELPIDQWQSLSLSTEGALINLWRPRELDE